MEICHSPSPSSVLRLWLPEAAAELGYFADLTAFATARLCGLLPDEVDAAVTADLDAAVLALTHGELDEGEPERSEVTMSFDLS